MNIVIVGAGYTGIQLAKSLVNEKNQVTLIDNDEENLRHTENVVDCTTITADGNDIKTLEEAGISKADALVCLTDSDEVNMITCSLVDAIYPDIVKIARVRNYAYYVNTAEAEKKQSGFGGKHRPLYGINYMIDPDVEAAEAIYQAVQNGALGNIITFDNTDLELASILVMKNSVFDGISLKEVRSKTDFPFLVAYLEQDGVTSLPSGDSVISEGTNIGVLVSKSDFSKLAELCGSTQNELKKIALVGAGKIGTLIAEKLTENKKEKGLLGFFQRSKARKVSELVIIDKDHSNAKRASETFLSARVVNADASNENVLNEEGITSFDLAICATHNHELNMVLAAYLESLGVKQSISLVTSAPYVAIAEKLGVDVSIPLRDCVVDSIMSHLRGKAVKEIHTITTGELEIVECEITSKSKVSGKLLKEISNPGNFLVLLHRQAAKEEYSIANGNSQIASGDHVVLITKSENSKKLLSYFAGTND